MGDIKENSSRRIELAVDPTEKDIVVTEEVIRFLELKYLEAILSASWKKENDETGETLKGTFTEDEKRELENLSQIFARRGITYARLASIMNNKHPDDFELIQNKVLDRVNGVLTNEGLFDK